MGTKAIDTKQTFSKPKIGINTPELLTEHLRDGRFIEEVELKEGEQTRVFLGAFNPNEIPSGFCVQLSSNATDENDIVKQVTRLELQDGRFEFILYIANYSSKATSVEIWRSS